MKPLSCTRTWFVYLIFTLISFSVALGCGGTSSENCTYLVQGSSSSITSPCTYTICKCSSNICRIRFDFQVSSNKLKAHSKRGQFLSTENHFKRLKMAKRVFCAAFWCLQHQWLVKKFSIFIKILNLLYHSF